jgi:hypothetical protein
MTTPSDVEQAKARLERLLHCRSFSLEIPSDEAAYGYSDGGLVEDLVLLLSECERLEATLAAERACHDCREYREMMGRRGHECGTQRQTG